MFLHYILNQKEDSLLYNCFDAQLKEPMVGNWILQVKNDLVELKINLTFDEINSQSKFTFRKIVKNSVTKRAFSYLMEAKSKQKKCCDIKFDELKIKAYLSTEKLDIRQKRTCFQMRTSIMY